MAYYIPDPHVDTIPVSVWRYLKWRFAVWLKAAAERWEFQAMDRCQMCGQWKHGRNHSDCDGIPF